MMIASISIELSDALMAGGLFAAGGVWWQLRAMAKSLDRVATKLEDHDTRITVLESKPKCPSCPND